MNFSYWRSSIDMDPALHPRSFRSFLAAARRRTAGSGLFYLLLPLFFSLAALAPSARPLGRLWKLPVVMMAAQGLVCQRARRRRRNRERCRGWAPWSPAKAAAARAARRRLLGLGRRLRRRRQRKRCVVSAQLFG